MNTNQPRPFWETLSKDAAANGVPINVNAPFLKRLFQLYRSVRNRPGFACVFWFRINQHMLRKGWRGSYRLRIWRQYRFGSNISPWADIGPGLYLPNPMNIMIGSSVKIGKGAGIYNGVTLEGTSIQNRPLLGDNVNVYTGSKVIGPRVIGDNSVIAALTLCKQDVPPNSILYGVPPHVVLVNKDNPHRPNEAARK